MWARNGRWILPGNARLPRSIQESFTCRKSTTWDWRLYFPSEGRRAEDFFALKNPTASAGFENLPRKFYFYWILSRMTGTLHEETHTFIITSRWIIFRMRNVSAKVAEKVKTYILCSVTFFSVGKSCLVWDDVKKYCRDGQTTDENMAHAHCMVDN